MRRIGISICLATLLFPAAGQELTPSGGPPTESPLSRQPSETEQPISFQQASAGLTSVFAIQLARMDQVVQNSYNWRGPNDASMRCDIGFAPQALVIRGEFRDDLPFFQTMIHPSMPDWWRIQYGADGIEFLLDDPTSATRRVRFALNFSTAAVSPQVELISSPLSPRPRFLGSASIELEDAPNSEPEDGAVQFRVAIPYTALAEPDFFRGPLRITARQHDVDGDFASYLMIQEAIEKK